MSGGDDAVQQDIWSQWLLKRRHAGDAARREYVQRVMEGVRDRVLGGAQLKSGMTLADIGAGEGLIGFGAIDQVGPSLQVVFTDVSLPLLEYARGVAEQRGVSAQCRFVLADAETLQGIGDATIDVITARAALAFVPDKQAAFKAFHRVLKPGGRISIAEPILQDTALETCALAKLIEAQPRHPDRRFLTLLHRYRAAQFPPSEREILSTPTTNFCERDLILFAREAGLVQIHLELHIDHAPAPPTPWETFLDISPHPWSPTLREVLAERFSADERKFFEETMRPTVESGQSITTDATAYLTAEKKH